VPLSFSKLYVSYKVIQILKVSCLIIKKAETIGPLLLKVEIILFFITLRISTGAILALII
jgi:hypothetical protein